MATTAAPTAPSAPTPSPNAASSLKTSATAAAPSKSDAKPTADSSPSQKAESSEGGDDNPFAELDKKMYGEKEKSTEEKPTTDGEESEESDDTSEDDTKADEKAKPNDDKASRTFKAKLPLREAIEKANSELKSVRETLAEREARITELESKGGETTAVAERLAAVEKERDEALAQVRGLRQESSPEFKEKYDKPFERAAADAKRFVEQVPVAQEDGTTRKASWEGDFALIYNLPEVEAAERAEELFGKHAQRVMARYDELHRLSAQRTEAAEAERAQWKQTEQQREAQAVQRKEAAAVAMSHADKFLTEKYPDLYAEDPKDPEGNALMKEWDQRFAAEPKTMAEWAHRQARIKNNARAFPRLAMKYKQAMERIAELEAQDASADSTEPGKTKRKGSPPPPPADEDFKASLAKLR